MNSIATNNTAIHTTKFSALSFVENGVIVRKKNKEEFHILFSEINKVYINKCKFSFLNKIYLTSFLLILSLFLVRYSTVEIVLIGSILYIPLFVKMNNYKSYQLYLLLYDGTSINKEFNKKTKQEHIEYVNTIRKEIFDNKIKYNIQFIEPIGNNN